MTSEALGFRGIAHSYGGPPILAGIDLSVSPGELISVLGASGSGKSTLLRSAAGFVTPEEGSVWLKGVEVCRDGVEYVPAEKRRVGMMFQDYALFPHMTVFENVAFGIRSHSDSRSRVDTLLDRVGLAGLEERKPGMLSGGQQQRVALARALAPEPSFLLLDEPFANLDGPLRFEMGALVREVIRSERLGAMLVTHDREEALGLSDRVALLSSKEGHPAEFLQVDSPQVVYESPESVEAARLTGRISLLASDSGQKRCVRPEEVSFAADPEGLARVVNRRYRGNGWELMVEAPEGSLRVDVAGSGAPEPGTVGRLEITSERYFPDEGAS